MAIQKSAQVNGLSNISVVQFAASENIGVINFTSSSRNPTAAAVVSHTELSKAAVPCVTVDEAIGSIRYLNTIVLIDVEGHEPSVMRGMVRLVKDVRPLIIFEYNDTSKKHFSLDDIRHILPDAYRFYRLRGDGRLDKDFSNSWNCVAVAEGTDFAEICKDYIV